MGHLTSKTSEETSRDVKLKSYMPTTFPFEPDLNPTTVRICAVSWERVMMNCVNEYFCEVFYNRLKVLDKSGRLNKVISMHCPGPESSKIAMKARNVILLRMLSYAVHLDTESAIAHEALIRLARSHAKFTTMIGLESYALFVQNMVNTLEIFLGEDYSKDVANAWIQLFAYILKKFLGYALLSYEHNYMGVFLKGLSTKGEQAYTVGYSSNRKITPAVKQDYGETFKEYNSKRFSV